MSKYIIVLLILLLGISNINYSQESKVNEKEKIKSKGIHTNSVEDTSNKMIVKDNDGNVLIQINDEGTIGSITIPDSNAAPSITLNKLYNLNGKLYYNGVELGSSASGGGWQIIGSNVCLNNIDNNVGIGNESPAAKLHITSTTSSFGMLKIENELHGANEASIGFKMGSDASGADMWVLGVGSWGSDSNFVIGRVSPKVVINRSGQFGIGTTTPQYKLDVNGNSRINANTSINDINPWVLLVNNSGSGYGITSTASANYGIKGECTSSNGEGVSGLASNITGFNYGGYFLAYGTAGTGVYGRAASSSGAINYGGYFEAAGSEGVGVYGYGNGWAGVRGESLSGYGGIFGSNNDHLDLMLTGPVGRINTDPNYGNSDLILSSNNDVIVRLDNDGGEDGEFMVKTSGGTNVCKITESGRLTTGELELTGGSDLSERFNITGSSENNYLKPGMVVSIDPNKSGNLIVSNIAYDKKVAGVISGAGGIKTGMVLGQTGSIADGLFPVALSGRVYCKADASSGEIQPGDLLTTSTIPGYAMKVSNFENAQGAIIGKAMSSLDEGQGLVLVLVSLH